MGNRDFLCKSVVAIDAATIEHNRSSSGVYCRFAYPCRDADTAALFGMAFITANKCRIKTKDICMVGGISNSSINTCAIWIPI
jgi:hypothetical protein